MAHTSPCVSTRRSGGGISLAEPPKQPLRLVSDDVPAALDAQLGWIHADLWQTVLRHLDLEHLCMFGACCRAAAREAFSCEPQWRLVCLPRKSEGHARGILRLGAALGKALCRHLDATSTPLLEDADLAAAAPALPLLERINLTGCRRVQGAVVTLVRSCPSLTALQVPGCPRLADAEIVELAGHGSDRLVHLDLSGCSSRVGDASALALAQCRALRELRLSNCKRLSDRGAVGMFSGTRAVDDQGTHLQHGAAAEGFDEGMQGGVGGGCLTSLELSSCEKITDMALQSLARHCSQMLHLDLSLSDTFSSGMVGHVLHSMQCLRSLDLVGVAKLTDDALIFLPTMLESISLAATCIGDGGVKILANRCPRTHSLDLAANHISDSGGRALNALSQLRSLNLNSTHITDETLLALGASAGTCFCEGTCLCQKQTSAEGGLQTSAPGGGSSGSSLDIAGGSSLDIAGGQGRGGGVGVSWNSGLLILNLRDCVGITCEGVQRFSESERGQELVHLDLRDSGAVRLAGARVLFPMLAAFNGKKKVRAEKLGALCTSGCQGCSLRTSGATFVEQHTFRCMTCGFFGKNGVCAACAVTCHKGHQVFYNGRQHFYCDCKTFNGASCGA